MIRISNLPLPVDGDLEQLRRKAARLLGLRPALVRDLTLVRQSIDARKKTDVHYVCTVELSADHEEDLVRRANRKNIALFQRQPYVFPAAARTSPLPPVVVGMGPAGLFAALFLARAGLAPIVLERGRPVEQRAADVAAFWSSGVLDPLSNVQFGEGGAGTFSDGKLTTGTHDGRISAVLEALVEHGAPEDILWSHKPHIGTDVLRQVVKRIRAELLARGCDVRFEHRLTGLRQKDGRLTGLTVAAPGGPYDLEADALVLAPGHSARDTFELLLEAGVPCEIHEDILYRQWSKLMLNVGLNQVCAVYNVPYRGVQHPGTARDTMLAAMREAQALAAREGVTLTDADISAWMKMTDALNPDGMPSMRQDTLARRPTEVELFAGAMRRLGEKHSVPTPVNDMLYRRIAELEAAY